MSRRWTGARVVTFVGVALLLVPVGILAVGALVNLLGGRQYTELLGLLFSMSLLFVAGPGLALTLIGLALEAAAGWKR